MVVTASLASPIEAILVVTTVLVLSIVFYLGYGALERFVAPPVIETIQRR